MNLLYFLMFVVAILLVSIFWELTKINSRLKKMVLPSQDLVKEDKR